MTTHLAVIFVNIMVATVVCNLPWDEAFSLPTCIVDVNRIIEDCKLIAIDPQCSEVSIPKYLHLLPHIYGKEYPPEVNRVQIVDHVVVNGKIFINISWTFKASGRKHIHIEGFLLQANIFTGRDIITQYFVVEYKTKEKHNFRFDVGSIGLNEATNRSLVVISIWSLLHTKHPRNDIITNRSICRQYTEVYEDVRQSAKSQGPRVVRLHSMKRTVRQHDKMDNGPCDCWRKEELSIETDATTNILVSSSNLCPERNQHIVPTNSYLRNSTKIINSEQCETDNCCIRFSAISDGTYSITMLYICDLLQSEDPPTCSQTRTIKVARKNTWADAYTTPSDKKKNVMTIVIVTVSVICGICSVIVFLLILRRRKQNDNRHAGDIELVHLIPSDVMFISLNSESNRNEVQASRRFQQMLTNFGVKTVNAFSIFNQIFEYNEKMSLQSLKARLAEKLDNYNYCVFITTKDLYQSFEKIGLSNICTSNVSMKDHEILHYILAEIIIKRIHGNAANHTISCHFIALDKTSIEYCGQIYSFIRPPVGKKYCISKESKFNMKHFKLLLNRLPSSFPNNEWTEEMNKFDPKSFLQILQRPNNLNPFHVQTRVSNQRKSDSDLTAPELSRLCSVPSTTRNMSDQDSNQTVLKSSICTSNTDGGTVPKMYGVATGLSSDANVTMVKITGGSEDDVTHAIKGKTSTEYSGVDATSTEYSGVDATSTEYSGVDATSTEIVDNDTINQTNVKDIMEFGNDTTTPKSVLDSDVNISNIDISYLPVVTVTHIKTFKNATTSADESDYVIKNSEYNKAEKKSVTFNLVAKEETSTIILDTESRQRYTDKIESDVSGTKTSEDRETGCTPMVSYLSFMDETSVNTYHNIKVETESFSQSMIEMPSCHHIHGIGFQDTSQEVSGSSDEECLIWETSVNKNTQSISKGENEDILFKETCL